MEPCEKATEATNKPTRYRNSDGTFVTKSVADLKAKSDHNANNSPLLKLAPELRNIIYEYAVCDKSGINITKDGGVPEAPLLLTCKAIRADAIGIYYTVNKISAMMLSYHPAALQLLEQKANTLLRSHEFDIFQNAYIYTGGPRSWPNLLLWLQLYHSFKVSRMNGPSYLQSSNAEWQAIDTMFDVAKLMKGKAWEGAVPTIALLHAGLVAVERQWSAG